MPLPTLLLRYARPAFYFSLGATSLILLNDSYLESTTITGPSMSPTLSPLYETTQKRDIVLWDKFQPTKNLQRGDVVLFYLPHNPEGTAVKRVIALGGDTVLLDPRRRPRDAENGRVNEAARKWDILGGRVVIPPGHVWVEGDNWRKTRDSNDYGPISRSLIVGKARACVVWPWGERSVRPWEGYASGTRVVTGREVVRRRDLEGIKSWEAHG